MMSYSSNSVVSDTSRTLLHESDWLGSSPVFYDIKNRTSSTSIQDVTPSPELLTFHPEGLYNYLDFGFSVLEQTPLKDVRFLRHSSRLWKNQAGDLEVEYLEDPYETYIDWRPSESDLIELIRERVQTWEASLPGDQEIVLPLSGGFDSRLLLWCLRDRSRVRCYTYGVSSDQGRSMEVVYAKTLAKKYGVRWMQIPLGDFHHYMVDWNAEYGLSTHAHGMYHFEFYSKIRENLVGRHAFLSGIFGDVWAGSVSARHVKNHMQLSKLGYTHELRADPSMLRIPTGHELREQFWVKHSEFLGDHRYQTVATIRFKIMLISYLLRIPRLYGFESWSPYLDIDIAMGMLNLPQERRHKRLWQKEFFAKEGLDLERQRLKSTKSNDLNWQALRKMSPEPLDADQLESYIDRGYLDWINGKICVRPVDNLFNMVNSVPKLGGALRYLNLGPRTLKAYYAYLCLKPLDMALEQKAK